MNPANPMPKRNSALVLKKSPQTTMYAKRGGSANAANYPWLVSGEWLTVSQIAARLGCTVMAARNRIYQRKSLLTWENLQRIDNTRKVDIDANTYHRVRNAKLKMAVFEVHILVSGGMSIRSTVSCVKRHGVSDETLVGSYTAAASVESICADIIAARKERDKA